MAMRCFGRTRLTVGCARALVLRSLALIAFRAVDLAAVLRAGDFFCAAVRAAARDVGFCLAIRCLPDLRRARLPEAPFEEVSRSSAARQRALPRARLLPCPSAAGTRRRRRAIRQA